MDSLQGTSWDVLIAGTGIQESLLALALSRSGKKVLHVDKNTYYGGAEAALSLQEAEQWCHSVNEAPKDRLPGVFSDATIVTAETDNLPGSPKLSFSRAYSLALAPQLIYTRSTLLSALVAAGVDSQIEFLAISNWWIYKPASTTQHASLIHVPSGREDVVADQSLDLKQKRSLMKFLRFVTGYEEQRAVWEPYASYPFAEFLSTQFKLSPAVQESIHAIALSSSAPAQSNTAASLPRVARHLTSIGRFGPGFGAVTPKWGGLAEIAQVGCRAGAVGGGVYVLDSSIKSIAIDHQPLDESIQPVEAKAALTVKLSTEDLINVDWVCASLDNLPSNFNYLVEGTVGSSSSVYRSISIVSSSLRHLFSQTLEGAPPPAGVVVNFPPASLTSDDQAGKSAPVYILVHSSSTGECPDGQCILYSSVEASNDGVALLDKAVQLLLSEANGEDPPSVLWTLRYRQRPRTSHTKVEPTVEKPIGERVLTFPPLSSDLALDDSITERVKEVWQKVSGLLPEDFMVFEHGNDDGTGELE